MLKYEKNISTKKQTRKERTWIYEKNENKIRKKRTKGKKSKKPVTLTDQQKENYTMKVTEKGIELHTKLIFTTSLVMF